MRDNEGLIGGKKEGDVSQTIQQKPDYSNKLIKFEDREESREFLNNNGLLEDYNKRFGEYSDSISQYKGSWYEEIKWYEEINNQLRTGSSSQYGADKVNSYISNIDAAFEHKSFEMSDNLRSYRGFSLNDEFYEKINNLKEGDVFLDKGFASTTLIKDVETSFHGNGNRVLLEIDIEAGVKMLPIDRKDFVEHEILLNRGSKFRVKGKSTEGGTTILSVSVSP